MKSRGEEKKANLISTLAGLFYNEGKSNEHGQNKGGFMYEIRGSLYMASFD